jgi:hypothetical protein
MDNTLCYHIIYIDHHYSDTKKMFNNNHFTQYSRFLFRTGMQIENNEKMNRLVLWNVL